MGWEVVQLFWSYLTSDIRNAPQKSPKPPKFSGAAELGYNGKIVHTLCLPSELPIPPQTSPSSSQSLLLSILPLTLNTAHRHPQVSLFPE